VGKESGLITVKGPMDRESPFVKNNNYVALIGSYDDGKCEGRLPSTAAVQEKILDAKIKLCIKLCNFIRVLQGTERVLILRSVVRSCIVKNEELHVVIP